MDLCRRGIRLARDTFCLDSGGLRYTRRCRPRPGRGCPCVGSRCAATGDRSCAACLQIGGRHERIRFHWHGPHTEKHSEFRRFRSRPRRQAKLDKFHHWTDDPPHVQRSSRNLAHFWLDQSVRFWLGRGSRWDSRPSRRIERFPQREFHLKGKWPSSPGE